MRWACATLCSIAVLAGTFPAWAQAESPEASSWSVSLKISGGFTGRGAGSVRVQSDGRVQYQPPAMPGQAGRPCADTLASGDLSTLADAVARSSPEGWDRPGLAIAAPDAFGYDLELRSSSTEGPRRATWHDNTRAQLPEDLQRLATAVGHAMAAAAKRCRGGDR